VTGIYIIVARFIKYKFRLSEKVVFEDSKEMSIVKFRNIFLIGPMGAGKSTIGRALAKELKLDFFDSDEEIELRAGANIAWIYDVEGEEGYRRREQKVIDELTLKTNIVLATGGGAIITSENRNSLAARGTVIYLKTSLQQQYERTKRDTKRPMLQTDDLEGRLESLRDEHEPLYEELADVAFETDKLTVKAVANNIIKYLYGES
jgi:shikimate kinase